MDSRLVARLRWYSQAGMKSLGLLGVIGLSMLVFCLAFYISTLQPAQEKLAEMQEQAKSLRAKLTHAKAQQAEAARPEVQLAKFYEFFPTYKNAPDVLEKLYAAAEATGITLEQGEYRLTATKGDKLDRYLITLPVKGAYPQIRKFIGKLLADLPAVSLDGVSFQRQKIGDVVVESQIKLTLYLGDTP